jgi:1-deoxy-D-xylulose 5-phosphate reductoisomerase
MCIRDRLWALERGVDLALANKESLVAAGDLAVAARERGGGRVLPVDSEHSAVFQCLEGRAPDTVHSIVLTASGGPFRGRNRNELEFRMGVDHLERLASDRACGPKESDAFHRRIVGAGVRLQVVLPRF